jgi:hypothetical protein
MAVTFPKCPSSPLPNIQTRNRAWAPPLFSPTQTGDSLKYAAFFEATKRCHLSVSASNGGNFVSLFLFIGSIISFGLCILLNASYLM